MRLESLELDRLDYKNVLRSEVDPKKTLEMKSSIEIKGLVSPVVAIMDGGDYKVVDGVLRLEIIKDLGWDGSKKIDVLIIDDSKTSPPEATILLNSLRENLSTLDEAEIINVLINDYGYKINRISGVLGKSETTIENLLRVFRLPPNILRALRAGLVTIAHCRQLTRLKSDPRLLGMIFRKTIKEKLTPRDLEIFISSELPSDQKGNYEFFTPIVVKTKAGSRLRFEPRKKSVRMELNVVGDDLGDVVKEMKAQLRKLNQGYLRDAG